VASSATLPGKGLGPYAKAAIAGHAIVPGRPLDYFGVGYFFYNFSNELQDAVARLGDFDDEQGIEAFYTLAVTPWLRLTADLQWVNPARARTSRCGSAACAPGSRSESYRMAGGRSRAGVAQMSGTFNDPWQQVMHAMKWVLGCVALVPVQGVAMAQMPSHAEKEKMDTALRKLGYVTGQAFQCQTKQQQVKLEKTALNVGTNILQLFGSNRAFCFAAAFGAGASEQLDTKRCAEYVQQADEMVRRLNVLASR
jgi:hypothetical protein